MICPVHLHLKMWREHSAFLQCMNHIIIWEWQRFSGHFLGPFIFLEVFVAPKFWWLLGFGRLIKIGTWDQIYIEGPHLSMDYMFFVYIELLNIIHCISIINTLNVYMFSRQGVWYVYIYICITHLYIYMIYSTNNTLSLTRSWVFPNANDPWLFQDSVTYNAVLAALRRATQWQGALEVLQHCEAWMDMICLTEFIPWRFMISRYPIWPI